MSAIVLIVFAPLVHKHSKGEIPEGKKPATSGQQVIMLLVESGIVTEVRRVG
jgi:hypothetical protein